MYFHTLFMISVDLTFFFLSEIILVLENKIKVREKMKM